MPLKYPDILEHNNSNFALVDVTELRGNSYPLGNLSETGSIPTDKRNVGAVVFVSSSQEFYGFYGQSTSDWDTTSNWKLISDVSGSATAPGSDTQILYNSGGVISADSGLVYSGSRVGIGTATPSSLLQVGENQSGSNYITITKSPSGTSGILFPHPVNPDPDYAFITYNAGEGVNIGGGYVLSIGADDRTRITNKAGSSTYLTVVNSTGNIGIGTTTPPERLTVQGNISGSGNAYIGGNVGIGTTTPNSKLQVAGDAYIDNHLNIGYGATNAKLIINSPLGTNTRALYTGEDSRGGGINMYQTGGNEVRLSLFTYTASGGSTNRLTVRESGNIGINTETPSYKLDVSGSGRFTDGLTVTGSILHDGDLTVTGTVTAQEFHTEFVSASIIYDSGSTKFGDSSDDVHQFTGSLEVSGSVRIKSPTNANAIFLEESSNLIRWSNGSYIGKNSYYSGIDDISFNTFDGTAIQSRIRIDASSGNVGISTTAPTNTLHVAGTTRLSGSYDTATSGSILTIEGSGSTQPIFKVQGSVGELFAITDSLSGSLFSVNDITGLPILEVFSDNTINLGDYQAPALFTTAEVITDNSGSFTVYSIPTSSYDGAFYEYTLKSGSNARAGNIMAIWSGTSVNFTETTTTDFGDTTGVSLNISISGSNMVLTGSFDAADWHLKTIIKSI